MQNPEFRLRHLLVPFYIPGFLWAAGAGAILPVLPLYIRALGADLPLTGIVMSMFALGALTGNVPASIVIARFGKRRTMIGAISAEVALAAAAAVVVHPYQLIPLLFALGAVHTLFFVARLAYFRELVPQQNRGRALSLLGGEMRMGSSIGPVLGGFAADTLGLRTAFVLLGLFSLFVLFFGIAFLPEESPESRARPRSSDEKTLRLMFTLLADKRYVFATAGFVVLALKLIREARKIIFPLWGNLIGMSSSAIGLLFGVAHLVELALFYPAGTIMDRWGRKKTAVPCLLLFSLGFILLPVARTPALFMLVAILVSIGNGIGAGINMTLSTDFAPQERTVEFLALWRTITDLGGAASPMIIGFVSATVSVAAAAPLVGLVGFAGAGMMITAVGETLHRRSDSFEP